MQPDIGDYLRLLVRALPDPAAAADRRSVLARAVGAPQEVRLGARGSAC